LKTEEKTKRQCGQFVVGFRPVDALVSRYLTNKLIGRETLPIR